MRSLNANTASKERTLSMVVYNADGTVKTDLGVVDYWHRSPLKRLHWRLVGKPAANARIFAHNQRSTNAHSESD